MARGDTDGPDPGSRRRRGSVANEAGLRALGTSPPSRRASGSSANESGLRALGAQVDRTHAGGRHVARTRRSGKARWSRRRKVVTTLGVVLALLVVAAGGLWAYGYYRFEQIPKTHVAAEVAASPGGPFNMLVVGSDSRVGTSGFGSASVVTGQRSDVVMVWHVNPQAKTIQILSIPRDTLVSMVGSDVSQWGTFNRINSSYNSGVNQLVQTIEANFGIPINHVVQVDFNGFQGAVNALGGVWMDFPQPAQDAYSGLNITQAGCQLLNGSEALAVARSRHYQYEDQYGYWDYDGTSDFGRIQRQDAFLRSLIDTAESKINPFTVNAFIGSLHEGIVIDDAWTEGELASLALDFHSFPSSALQTQTLPTLSEGYVSPWGDILFVDQPAAQQMLYSIFGSELTMPTSPPPDENLEASAPPSLTGAGGNTGSTGNTGAATVSNAGSAAAPTTTTTTVPSFNPTPCKPS